GGSVLDNVLDGIEDSWGQNVHFKYQPGADMPYSEMIIISPDGIQSVVSFASDGVHTIGDQEDHQTSFEYTTSGSGQRVLSQIQYPTGLISRFDYTDLPYLNVDGSTGYTAAVENYYKLNEAGHILEHTMYRYGIDSANRTFTGAAIGCTLGGLRDHPMEGNSGAPDYK
ncbi:MAG: hypothetical protein Q9214_006982, partial [Letrouitia sp. 1 TL-2023]